jgi:ABC-type dipeptide/oligopeptide/nickel transport system ATPase component
VAIMHEGQIVESGAAEDVLREPRHEYTRALLQAHPRHEPRREVAAP